MFVGDAFGKLADSTHINELGERVADALIDYMLALPGIEDVSSINPIVGETKRVITSFIIRLGRVRGKCFCPCQRAVPANAQAPE